MNEKEITIDQHLGNIAYALNHGSLTISNANRSAIITSFNHIVSLLIPKEETN